MRVGVALYMVKSTVVNGQIVNWWLWVSFIGGGSLPPSCCHWVGWWCKSTALRLSRFVRGWSSTCCSCYPLLACTNHVHGRRCPTWSEARCVNDEAPMCWECEGSSWTGPRGQVLRYCDLRECLSHDPTYFAKARWFLRYAVAIKSEGNSFVQVAS